MLSQDRDYDALLLDLDGTLLDSHDRIHARTRAAIDAVRALGVHVMVVTGRSIPTGRPILEELGLHGLAVLFNGAAVWSIDESRLVEERVLGGRTLESLHGYREHTGDLAVVMSAERKLCLEPRSLPERDSLTGLTGLEFVDTERLEAEEHVLRVTFLSDRYGDSDDYARSVIDHVRYPVYATHFPLNLLPRHRSSAYHAVDVHAPCRGKAEALRVLLEHHGVQPERVVAVGDAYNDAPMLAEAGLAVAMGNAVAPLRELADRTIGHHDGDAIGRLVEELWLQ